MRKAFPISWRSYIGINAVNFLMAELAGVNIPFLNAYLKQHGWRYDTIGFAVAMSGVGVFLMQIPAGVISDHTARRRILLGAMSIILGACYAMLPLFAGSVTAISLLMFVSAAASAFYIPLLATLALSLVGRAHFDQMMGINQAWNHAGNIAAALVALLIVKIAGLASIFYVTGVVSACAAFSLVLIRQKELHPDLSQETAKAPAAGNANIANIIQQTKILFHDKTIVMLVISVALFHIANAPMMPLVGLYLKALGSNDSNVAMVVLIAQTVMIPASLLAATFCASRGRKPVFAFAFLVLPIRILLYTTTTNPTLILAIQALDGICAGIYGVVIALICSDLTKGKAGFNTLLGIMQTALALGWIIGPLMQGCMTQHFGFIATFIGFAAVAGLGAVIFLLKVPETKHYKFTKS
jgi:predicted MFS family arabinose efflux permease